MLPVMLGITGAFLLMVAVIGTIMYTVFVFPAGVNGKIAWVSLWFYVVGLAIALILLMMGR